MSFDESDFQVVRQHAIELLRDDRWNFCERAKNDLRQLGYTQVTAADLILRALEGDLPINLVRLGDPPGSGGIGYTMNRVDGRILHVKFILAWDWTEVIVLSFHNSVHTQKVDR